MKSCFWLWHRGMTGPSAPFTADTFRWCSGWRPNHWGETARKISCRKCLPRSGRTRAPSIRRAARCVLGFFRLRARSRVLNELRRRSRKPESDDERDGSELQELPDGARPPDQAVWEEYRRSAIQKAIGTLAPPQRQALSLAFFEDLTHEQVAETLKVPLGTTKTRIRSGIQQLRIVLAAMAAALVAVVATRFAFQYSSERARETQSEAALRMVTSSDTQVLRLVATPDAPSAAHGHYRTRPGASNAVLTFSGLPRPPSGKSYQAWTRREGKWTSLGQGVLDASEHGLIVYQERTPLASPEALQLTLEPEGGSASPTGPPLIMWPGR